VQTAGDPTTLKAQDYETFLQDNFGSAASLVMGYYPLSAFNSTPYPPFFAISTVFTDSVFKCTAYRGLNRAVEKGVPVWTYMFNHVPSCSWFPGITLQALPLVGATHTAEIPFVFGNLDNLPAPNGTCNFTPQERSISAFLLQAWTSMAANQDPSSNGTLWPAYGGASNPLGINIVNYTSAGVVDYSPCLLWDKVDVMLRGPTIAA
jgi:carboxylesterase type B